MRLDQIPWGTGGVCITNGEPPYWRNYHLGDRANSVITECLRDGVNGTHLVGEYIIDTGDRLPWTGRRRSFEHLDPIAAQAILYYLLEEEEKAA